MITTQKAAGFKIPKRTARLVFSGDYEGAEVVVRLNIPVGTFLDIQTLVDEQRQKEGTDESAETIRNVFQVFGDIVLDEWNLQDDDGKSIPCNAEGMNSIPVDLANIILSEWSEVAVQTPDPLEEG